MSTAIATVRDEKEDALDAPPRKPGTGTTLRRIAPGVVVAAIIGVVAFFIAHRTPAMSPLIWAILVGAVIGNTVKLPASLAPGVAFSGRHILRLAVGLLGIRLGLAQIVEVGAGGFAIIVVGVGSTFVLTSWIGRRLGLTRSLSTVVAAGTSICGAAAIVAVAGVVDAKEEETAVGVGTVTLLGTLAMLLYPVLGHLAGMTPETFGVWAGASIHEVAQVVAAAFSFDAAGAATSAVEVATAVKLGRVLLLAPMAIALTVHFRTSRRAGAGKVSPLPWFITLFVVMMVLRSTGIVPAGVTQGLVAVDTVLLAVAMGALGLDLRWVRIKAAGARPLYAAVVGTAFLAVLSFVMTKASID